MLADEIPVARQHAAEILRPRPVDRAVDDHVADLAGAQFLRLGRKTEKCIDLSGEEEILGHDGGIIDPMNIFGGIKAEISGHNRYQFRDQTSGSNAHGSVFQVSEAADLFAREQLEAPDVHAREDCDRQAGIQPGDRIRRE